MQFSTKFVSFHKPMHNGARAVVFSTTVALFFGIAPASVHAQSADPATAYQQASPAPLFLTRAPSYANPSRGGQIIKTFWVNQAGSIVPTAYVADTAGATNGAAAVNAPAQPLPKPLITLDFTDVSVADLIEVIAKQGNVGIMIGADVTARLKTIHLINKTPEDAIKIVAQYSGLSWTKIDDDTYAIANKPADLPANKDIRNLDSVPSSTLALPAIAPRGTQDTNTDANGGEAADNANADFRAPALAPRAKQVQDDPKEYARIQLHNVSPHLMAYWLDPAHNSVPPEYRDTEEAAKHHRDQMAYPAMPGVDPRVTVAQNGGGYFPAQEIGNWSPNGSSNQAGNYNNSNYGNYGNVETQRSPQFGNVGGGGNRNNGVGGANGANAAVFDLPDGIDSLVAVDPQNVLLVYGTDEGIQKLQQIIGFLDHPLRQVEIEAQFVTVTQTGQKEFGLDFSSANGPFQLNHVSGISGDANQSGGFSIALVRDNFQATINSLVSRNQGKTVASPRVLAINNIPASISSSLQTPILLTSSTASIGGQVGQSQNVFFVTTSIELDVTPTINNDDTITVLMNPQFQSQSAPFGNTGVPVVTTESLMTIANIKDGDTIALGGLRTKDIEKGGQSLPILSDIPILGGLFRTVKDTTDDSDLIIFLTARIQRRIENPVPGT